MPLNINTTNININTNTKSKDYSNTLFADKTTDDNKTVNMTTNYDGSRATERGTRIVKPGSEMNKNSFLKILSAELSNQNPDSTKDSGQFITQMAQFTSMEQTSNLNNTMTSFAQNSLVGKGVSLKVLDSNGTAYAGIVRAVSSQNGVSKISVEVNNNGKNEIKDFDYTDVDSVLSVPDYSLSALNSLNGNTSFLMASSFMGKEVELSEKDSSGNFYQGSVVGVYKESGQIKLKLQIKDSQETLDVNLDTVNKVGDLKKMNSK